MPLRLLPSSRAVSRCVLGASPSVMYHVERIASIPVSRSIPVTLVDLKIDLFWTEFSMVQNPLTRCVSLSTPSLTPFPSFSSFDWCFVLWVWVTSANLFSFLGISKCFPNQLPFSCRLCLSLQEFLHYLIGTILLLIASIVAASKSYNLTGLVAGAVRLTLFWLPYILSRISEIYYLLYNFLTNLPRLCLVWMNYLLAHFSECSVVQCQQKHVVVRLQTQH